MIVLLPHCGFLSETTRMLAIARALQQQGETFAVATHGGPFTRVLTDAGIPFTLLSPEMDGARCQAYVDGVIALGRPGTRLQPADELRESVRSEAAFLREVRADLVVIGFTLSAYLSSRVVGVPLATSHGGSFVPPVFERRLAAAPTQAPAPALNRLPGFALRFMANTGAPRMRGPVRFLNEVAAELGVEPVPSLAALMVGDLTLVTDVPEVLGIPADAMAGWRPKGRSYRSSTRLQYTGPLFARLDTPIPERVQDFLGSDRPTAYVAPTSCRPEFVRLLVGAVREAGLRAVVAGAAALTDLEGDDVVVADLLPSHAVMPQVDLAVITGGQGSVQTAMATGTPFVGLPLQPEQEFNVSLAVRHGMALALGPRTATVASVAGAVRSLSTRPSHRECARQVQGHYAGVDGAALAARALRAHLATHAARPGQTPSPTA